MNESTLVPREDMSDLDWLARNVHAWPVNAKFAVRPGMGEVLFYEHHYSHLVQFSREQVEARRAELQNKPSWEDAPEWVGWLAQDKSGAWWFFRCHPKAMSEGWDSDSSAYHHSSWVDGEALGDWRDTLEKRPEGNIKSMSGVHSNGDMEKLLDELNDIDESIFGDGFIPKDAATAKQPAPKGSGNPILGMVLADLTNRALEGKEKYGEPLLANNGRNPLWDAYQEALDLAMYLRQAIEEQKQ